MPRPPKRMHTMACWAHVGQQFTGTEFTLKYRIVRSTVLSKQFRSCRQRVLYHSRVAYQETIGVFSSSHRNCNKHYINSCKYDVNSCVTLLDLRGTYHICRKMRKSMIIAMCNINWGFPNNYYSSQVKSSILFSQTASHLHIKVHIQNNVCRDGKAEKHSLSSCLPWLCHSYGLMFLRQTHMHTRYATINSSPPSAEYMSDNRVSIGSDNGLSPIQRRAII